MTDNVKWIVWTCEITAKYQATNSKISSNLNSRCKDRWSGKLESCNRREALHLRDKKSDQFSLCSRNCKLIKDAKVRIRSSQRSRWLDKKEHSQMTSTAKKSFRTVTNCTSWMMASRNIWWMIKFFKAQALPCYHKTATKGRCAKFTLMSGTSWARNKSSASRRRRCVGRRSYWNSWRSK